MAGVDDDGSTAASKPEIVGTLMTMPTEADVVLVVEDDTNISDLVELYLRKDGFNVVQATTGVRALELISERNPKLVVLDLGLPGQLDGFDVCRQIRSTSALPVLMVTARDDEIDRILGLELGADDYVTKPFSPRELIARVHAILRRSETPESASTPSIEIGSMVVDRIRHEVRVDGVVVDLAGQEFALLAHLVEHRGQALSRRQLLDGAWGMSWVGDERTVDVHVRQLRKKLGDALALDTVRGVGYRMN